MASVSNSYVTSVDQLKIFADRVLVLPILEEEKASGIIIPEDIKLNQKKEMQSVMLARGRVVATGPGKDGKPMSVVPGDIVYLYASTSEADVKIGEDVYFLVREHNISMAEVNMQGSINIQNN